MSATTKGFPYPASGAAGKPRLDIQALAQFADGIPGIQTVTTAQRDALTTLWPGIVVFNSSLGSLQVNVSGIASSANWASLATVPDDSGWVTTGLAWGGAGWTGVTSGNYPAFAYRKIGDHVFYNGAVRHPTGSASGPGDTIVTFPSGARPTRPVVCTLMDISDHSLLAGNVNEPNSSGYLTHSNNIASTKDVTYVITGDFFTD